jgi:isoleucyl-tRNA synthetase
MKPVSPDISFPQLEESVLEYWKDQNIFQRSMDPCAPTKLGEKEPKSRRKTYVFYDGPPFATGLPHYGHLLAGTIKDVVGRFFTMKGYHVDRRFGWDCHGVPVEFEIQKSLSLHGANAIREFGIANFNEECRKIVLRYTKEWQAFVERSGRWVDFERQYRTMDPEFMESIWWVIKSLWDRGLVYEGVKCVPYSWAINTTLSNFEAGLNYKDVQDPAVTVRATVKDDVAAKIGVDALPYPVSAYIWTTTPWTLPSNMAFAVGADISYSLVANHKDKEVVILASNLVGLHFPELAEDAKAKEPNGHQPAEVLAEVKGSVLDGLEYEPMFPYFAAERENRAFRLYTADFVSDTDGTGIVHCASFGEDDILVFNEHNLTVVDPVDEDGNFMDSVPDFAGMNVKDADSKIIAKLKKEGAIVDHKTIVHSYPFCYRTDKPLIYKSIPSWFINVKKIREELIELNKLTNWVPDHVKEGRFGNLLKGAPDWAISRNRFWGTPLPVWVCEECGEKKCIGSVSELEEKADSKVSDLHRHFIDDLKFPCEACGKAEMARVPFVLDCWVESGSMPYAQNHYPFENKEYFEENFPADFIAEGLDQTRGWFYTLLVLSTGLFGRPAFRNVIVNGIVLAEDGKKMSKSLKNYPPPDGVMNEFGADAMRIYLLASAATRAEDLRFSEPGVKQSVRQTLLPLWNAYNFFVTYALVDGWTPENIPTEASENLLDRWILSKVNSLTERVDEALSSYRLYAAVPPVLDFVDQLTNWYIRLNRRRFWAGNEGDAAKDKSHAYATLHEVLLTFVRVLAPLAPFISEEIFRNLSEGVKGVEMDSVHLTPFPSAGELKDNVIDESLERSMDVFEEVILLGRGLRNDQGLKVRQPLQKITVIHSAQDVLDGLQQLESYILEELNIKEVEYTTAEEKFVSLTAQLNTKKLGKVLGPKLGADGMRTLRDGVQALTTEQIRKIEAGGSVELAGEELKKDDIIIRRDTKPGVKATASSGSITIVLDIDLTQELRLEGLAREFVNRVQKLRKDVDFEVTDRILVTYMTACSHIELALQTHADYVQKETLAVEMTQVDSEDGFASGSEVFKDAQEIDGRAIIIAVQRIQG